MKATETAKTMRCKKHPDFDPFDRFQKNDSKCDVCCDLHDGARPIGHFGGEFTADAIDIEKAMVKIGPLNLAQFGGVRFSLGWDYHFEDGPCWYVDEKTMTIYLNKKISDRRTKEFKKMKCKISILEWKEVIL